MFGTLPSNITDMSLVDFMGAIKMEQVTIEDLQALELLLSKRISDKEEELALLIPQKNVVRGRILELQPTNSKE